MSDILVYLATGLVVGAPVPIWLAWLWRESEVNVCKLALFSFFAWVFWPISSTVGLVFTTATLLAYSDDDNPSYGARRINWPRNCKTLDLSK